MRHTLTLLAALALTACAGQRHAARETGAGQDTLSYAVGQTRELTQGDILFFYNICETYGGLQYTPVWLTTTEGDDGTHLHYYCNGQNGRNVTVDILRPAQGKPVITEIKQAQKPRHPTDVVTVFYDAGVGSGPLDAVLSTQDCEVLQRNAEMCSVTIRLGKGDTRTLLENTKGVLSVVEHQMMRR